MGVTGLWRLIDASGKPVPLESLQGKVLAIDVSIWIHQVLQGYQDCHGNSKPNAHLIGLFNRICKLLYYKIKPVFVFDGGVPMLKKHTIAARRRQKAIIKNKAEQMKADLLNNLIKHKVVKTALNTEIPDDKDEASRITNNIASKKSLYDMFKLPDSIIESQLESEYVSDESDSDNSIIISPKKQNRWLGNIHDVNVNTLEFKSLPPDVRYDILTDLKETRKQNSWGRLNEMPEESHEFSNFQMRRLLKRRYVQEALESAEQEMGGKTLTLEELDKLLTEQGIKTVNDKAYRIASDSTTRVIYISDKNALVQSASQSSTNAVDSSSPGTPEPVAGPSGTTSTGKNVYEYRLSDGDSDSEITNLSSPMAITENINEYKFDSDWEAESELNESQPLSKKYFGKLKSTMNPALIYMLEHSDLTQEQILQLIEQNQTESSKQKIIKNKSSSSGRNTPEENSMENKNTKEIEHKDKSGLSQEQILQLIKQNQEESEKVNTEEKKEILSEDQKLKEFSIEDKVLEKTISQDKFEEFEDSAIYVDNSVQQIEEIDNRVQSTEETNYMSKSNDSKNSSFGTSILDDSVDISKHVDSNINSMISNNSEISEVEKIKQQKLSPLCKDNSVVESDSDSSDDFIEIPDVFVPSSGALKSNNAGRNIEITLNSTDKVEDDIFADIFNDLPAHYQKNNFSNGQLPSSEIGNIFKRSLETTSEEGIGNRITGTCDKTNEKELEETTKKRADEKEFKVDGKEKKEEKIQIVQSNTDNETNIMNKQSERHEINLDTMATSNESQVLNVTQNSKVEAIVLPQSKNELLSLKEHLEDEQKELEGSLGKLERQAMDISEQISIEAQELLRLFGIPYVVAPMEAEAQCAYLEQIKLTDGSITDDSDIWLFGGQCVYKNFFAHNKKVLQFCLSDIQHHFKLSRHQMIQLALLLGSDYTTGVPGIGPVTALEILAAFPSHGDNLLHGLINFCAWMNENGVRDFSKRTLRNKLRNVKIEKGFPSQAVVQAYLFPSVEESREGFTWGKPNPVLLADYTNRKFGWSRNKFEMIMKPVFKKMEDSGSQKFIENFFKYNSIPKSIEITMSKRVQKAVQRLHNGNTEDEIEEEKEKNKLKKVQMKGKKKKRDEEENNEEKAGKSKPKKARKVSKKKEAVKEGVDIPKPMNIMSSEKPVDTIVPNEKPKTIPATIYNENSIKKEIIPQREKDKANALKNRLYAIEVLRKSKFRKSKSKKPKENIRKVMKEANLSESSDSN